MAIPPEPIEELLPEASLIVEAEVAEVIKTGPKPPEVQAPRDFTSVPQKVASQVVRLQVKRVVKGELPAEAADSQQLQVAKPLGAYSLVAGNQGPFMLREGGDGWVILGRYGPDTYTLRSIESVLNTGG